MSKLVATSNPEQMSLLVEAGGRVVVLNQNSQHPSPHDLSGIRNSGSAMMAIDLAGWFGRAPRLT